MSEEERRTYKFPEDCAYWEKQYPERWNLVAADENALYIRLRNKDNFDTQEYFFDGQIYFPKACRMLDLTNMH